MSSTDTGNIWSCTIFGTELCDCVSEVAAVGTAVQSLAVDEARVYWTNGSGIFYIERNSDPTVVLTLSSSMMDTSIIATSPGLQQLPGACCMSKSTLFSVDYAYDLWGILGCVCMYMVESGRRRVLHLPCPTTAQAYLGVYVCTW